MNPRHAVPSLAALALVLAAAAPARAQSIEPDTAAVARATAAASATMLRGGPLSELLSIYVPRDAAEIEKMLTDAKAMQRSSAGEIDQSRRLATEADGRARIMKEEIKTSRVRRDVAKKAKEKATQSELAATVKRQERELKYLEKMREALRADADRLEAEKDAAAARVKSLEAEAKVARKYAELNGGTASSESVAPYRSMLRDLLAAQRQAADKSSEAASTRKRVADRRMKQLQALSKL